MMIAPEALAMDGRAAAGRELDATDVAVQFDQLAAPGATMQVIDVLCDQQAVRDASLDFDQGVVRRIRLHFRNELSAPRIPIPDELGVNRKRGRCRKLQRIESRPQTGLRIAKRRHSGLGGDARPGQHGQRARAGKRTGGFCRGSALLRILHRVEAVCVLG